MQGEQAYPACNMDRILMRVISFHGNFIGNIMNCNNGIEDKDYDEERHEQCKIIKEHISTPSVITINLSRY